jgi:hypothetical protein
MSNKLPFENRIKEALYQDFGDIQGETYFNRYTEAKTYLKDNVYGEIKGIEPQLSDHSERHINNVLKNVNFLIQDSYNNLDGINLYCLGIIILFHDVGNIEGRDGHHKKIAAVYNRVRNKKHEFDQERSCVLKAAGAHTGFNANDGSTDTLKDVPIIDHIDGYKIHLRELASLLRLADECAEGYQRTSDYLNSTNAFHGKSKIYHKYAGITHVFIDKGGERIVLTYNIDIKECDCNANDIKDLLEFIFIRIIKLDIERRYCKHYTQLLYDFKKTEATINFSIDGIPIEYNIPTIVLEDRYPIPKKDEEIDLNEIEGKNEHFKISKIVSDLVPFFEPKEVILDEEHK